jgi:uncharacterized heparinase superfamily protein
MLSFELSLRGNRVITDSGVYDYTNSPQRAHCRSTAAHNTVEVNGLSQCDFWDVFRVARRGTVHDVIFTPCDGGFELRAWHDGYLHRNGRARHERTFRWSDRGVLAIIDAISCDSPVNIVSRLHLHPDCAIVSSGADAVQVRYPAGQFTARFSGPGTLACGTSPYFPEFNREVTRPVIEYRARVNGRASVRIEIEAVP